MAPQPLGEAEAVESSRGGEQVAGLASQINGLLQERRAALGIAGHGDDGAGVLGREREAGAHLLGALHQQAHRIRSGQRMELQSPDGVRQAERRHREDLLAAHAQRGAAGDQHVHPGARRQQLEHVRRGGEDLLEIVEDEQQPQGVERGAHRRQGLVRAAQVERLRHRRMQQPRIRQ
jgi:hypothetical protein